jgi:hypothetical protein
MIVEDLVIQGPIGENKDYTFSCKVKLSNQSELVLENESILEIWKNLSIDQQQMFVKTYLLQIIDAKIGQ